MFVISPHFDDAALGIGDRMSAESGTLVTVFGGAPDRYPPLVMRPHDDRCGFAEVDDVMAVRRAEDRAAADRLGWNVVHLNLLDEQYREERRSKLDTAIFMGAIKTAWEDAGQPHTVWCPVGVNHPDHTWVRIQTTAFALPAQLNLNVWLEPGYRSFYTAQAERVSHFMRDVHHEGIEWDDAREKLKLIRCYASQLNGISALAMADALTSEVWGPWGGGG